MSRQGALQVVNQTRGLVLADRAELADSFVRRLCGLLGRPGLLPGQGLLLTRCSSIHTLGMQFPIDVLYLDPAGRVLAHVPALAPGRLGPWVRGARSILELPAGAARGTEPGDLLIMAPGGALQQ